LEEQRLDPWRPKTAWTDNVKDWTERILEQALKPSTADKATVNDAANPHVEDGQREGGRQTERERARKRENQSLSRIAW